MLSCILRSPLQVARSQAVRHDLSGGLLTCLVVLGQKCTIVCTGAERSSLWRRCRLRRRFPLCFRQMQQGCRCDDLSISPNVCPFNVLMTWYILYLYYFTLNKSCLSLSLSLETFSVLLAFWAGNSPVTSEFLTEASNAELWCFLWYAPEQTVEQTLDTLDIWDAITLIMTSLYCKNFISGSHQTWDNTPLG